MSQSELDRLLNIIVDMRRDMTITEARVKALEAMAVQGMKKEQREDWYKKLDELTREFHQKALEAVEDKSPMLAARLDQRKPGEMP